MQISHLVSNFDEINKMCCNIFLKRGIIQRKHYNYSKDVIIQVKTSNVFKSEIQAYYALKKHSYHSWIRGLRKYGLYRCGHISSKCSIYRIQSSTAVKQFSFKTQTWYTQFFNRKKNHIFTKAVHVNSLVYIYNCIYL